MTFGNQPQFEHLAPLQLFWNHLEKPKGFLFIGDPHVSSVRPGKRNDDYTASVLGKLSEAARAATHLELIPVILGDLIHREAENSIGMVSKLIRVLKEFPCTPLELGGNGHHGRHELDLVDEDIECLLQEARVLHLLSDPNTRLDFEFSGQRVRLHIAPYGAQIPIWLDKDAGVFNILLTHHDLGFDTAYPGAQPLVEIKGVDILVNGHMHKTSTSVKLGQTVFHNPGNIEPLSIDCRDHRPAVWEWTPELGQGLVPHYLTHNTNCFNLAGTHVEAATSTAGVEALKESRFAALLGSREHSGQDAVRTDEAAFLGDDLDAVLASTKVSSATATLLRVLASEVAQEAINSAASV